MAGAGGAGVGRRQGRGEGPEVGPACSAFADEQQNSTEAPPRGDLV